VKYSLFFLIFFYSCNGSDTNRAANTTNSSSTTNTQADLSSASVQRFPDSILVAKIVDSIYKLSFVQKSHRYIDSFSHHEHGIAFMSDTSDNKVMVTAGYNGPERFETYYIFMVDPKTFKILVMDPATSDYISVGEYLKRNKE